MVRKNYLLSNLQDSNKSTYGKRKGDAGCTYAKYRAKMDGYIVCSEDSDAFDFDFTIFNDGKHFSVQAKSSAYSKTVGTTRFTPVKRVRRFVDGKHQDVWMKYSHVDIFAFVDLRYELIAWIPFNEIKNSKKTLSLKEFEHWRLDRIIGKPIINETEEEIYIPDKQQALFKGEINGN